MEIKSSKVGLVPILVATTLAAVLLLAITTGPIGASPAGGAENFFPTDDSHVSSGQPDAVAEGGQRYNVYVGHAYAPYLLERGYFKFNLENIPSDSTIDNAVLWAHSRYGPSGEDYDDPTWHLVDAMSVDNDGWLENELTWNNAPPMGTTVFDTENFQADDFLVGDPRCGDPDQGQYVWYSWDVTSYVEDELARGDPLVSIGLKMQDEEAYESAGWFYSKDAHEDQPRVHLRVNWSAKVVDGGGISLLIYVGAAVVVIVVIVGAVLVLKRSKPSGTLTV